jgi:hypothetical protein
MIKFATGRIRRSGPTPQNGAPDLHFHAYRSAANRYVVRTNEKLTAFFELETGIRS